MATGEKTWSSQGKTPAKFESKPIPAGEYDLKINGDWVSKVAEGEGKVPYLSGSFTALGSGQNGGKDRKVFHMLFLSLKPGSDGVTMPERGNGILGLVRGLGTNINPPVVTMQGQELLSPNHIKQWLKANDGAVVRASVKIEKDTGGYPDKNRIEFFVESEQQDEAVDEAPAEVEEEAGFPEPDAVEEEAEFESLPKPKVAAKPTAPGRGRARDRKSVV